MALIGYMRVSKADGSQALDLQRDALIEAGVAPAHIYEDRASGRRDDRPGLLSGSPGSQGTPSLVKSVFYATNLGKLPFERR